MKIADLKALLEASNTKHSNFKNKAQQYKQQKEAKTERYKERMRKMEEEFQVKNFIEQSMICFSLKLLALSCIHSNILSFVTGKLFLLIYNSLHAIRNVMVWVTEM